MRWCVPIPVDRRHDSRLCEHKAIAEQRHYLGDLATQLVAAKVKLSQNSELTKLLGDQAIQLDVGKIRCLQSS
jgi:hypothetical protein